MSSKKSILILIGGGHSAGKKTVSEKLEQGIKKQIDAEIKCIDLDQYLNKDIKGLHGPQCYDFKKFKKLVFDLQKTSKSAKQVIIITGLYALYDRELRAAASMKVFVDCDADTRLNRWIMKDVVNGDSKLEDILEYYLTHARPEFNEFIQPTKEVADVILPSEDDATAIELICDGVVPSLSNLGFTGRALYPRLAEHEHEHALNLISENYDNRFYDLS